MIPATLPGSADRMTKAVEPPDDPFACAFTSSPLPQWIFDRTSLRIVAVNGAALVEYGYTRAEFLAMCVFELHPEDEQEAARSFATQPLHARSRFDERVWRHRLRGDARSVRMAIIDLPMARPAGRLVQVVDVTAEARLQAVHDASLAMPDMARQRADAVNRSKDAFLATLGHELRQPLAPIQTAISVMEQRISHAAGVRARAVIKRQVGVLMRLVDDLLDAARVQQGKIALHRETHDVRRLVQEIVASTFAEVAARKLILDTSLPAMPVWISLDATRFHQILSNLLSNAVRHSEPGGRVRVRVEVRDATVHLIVIDEGHGIEPHILPRIFEPFAQAADGANGGLGIGLSVVRALVELHGGQVTAASQGAGQGAAFTLTLPLSLPPTTPAHTFGSELRSVAESVYSRAAIGETQSLEGMLDDFDTALLIADDDSRVRIGNAAARALTGYDEAELRTLCVADLLAMRAPDTHAHWRDFAGQGRQEGILVLRRKDGADVPVRYCAIRNVRPGLHLSALDAL